jgi:hypothetical protein
MPLLRPRRVEGEDYENALRLWYAEFEKRLAYVVANEMGTTSSHDSEQDSDYEDEDDEYEVEFEDEYDYVENPMKTLTYQLKMHRYIIWIIDNLKIDGLSYKKIYTLQM